MVVKCNLFMDQVHKENMKQYIKCSFVSKYGQIKE